MADAERVTVAVGQEVDRHQLRAHADAAVADQRPRHRLDRRTRPGVRDGHAGGRHGHRADDDAGTRFSPRATSRCAACRRAGTCCASQPRGPRDAEELVGLTTVTRDRHRPRQRHHRPAAAGHDRAAGSSSRAARRPRCRAAQARVMVEPTDMRGLQMMISGPPEVADDFTFRIRGAMGSVLVRANGPPGWYRQGGRRRGRGHHRHAGIRCCRATSIRGARVLLTQAVSTVSGSVRDDRGDVVVNATVLVFPDDDARWTFSSRFIRTTRPDTEGRFELAALPPSSAYRIVAAPVPRGRPGLRSRVPGQCPRSCRTSVPRRGRDQADRTQTSPVGRRRDARLVAARRPRPQP